MLLEDMFNKSVPGYHSQEDDNSALEIDNSRKTRLTLMQINKLRQMNDIRNYEHKKKLKVIKQQYGTSADAGGDMDF